ncbi:uncharacterized protein [Pagrus major]|uniref:uncharacterized protein n=1 Tax=Pagrus major TaxID=143350 RepID=UPI003CC89D67
MSSVEYLREFVNQRLTAAAEEIFRVFKKTIVEYEEEIDRQRRLFIWKPETTLDRIELPQQHVYKEEKVLADQQLCDQERNFSLDQEDPEPPQIKEEQEELCTSQEGEQLVVKLETDTFMLIPPYEESDHSGPESESDHQLLFYNSHVAESQDQTGGNHQDSGSTLNTEPEPMERHCKSRSQHVYNPNWSEIHCNTQTGKKSFICDTCGKAFNFKSNLNEHMRIHTGEKPYSCDTCGKTFCRTSDLNTHIRTHTGEKPYSCDTCGKRFRRTSELKNHIRTHTGEKPYLCRTCGKDFSRNEALKIHMRRAHTGEKPYLCKICGKRFFDASHLAKHIRAHTGKRHTMSSIVCFREFVNERLTAAAEEIFGVFIKTIVEYEEEIDRQRRLLDIIWKPEIKLQRIVLPQQHVCLEEEVQSGQQLCNQERNSSEDQEDPEPPQIKEEQEELCISQEGEQLVLKLETDTFMLTPTYEENDHSEPEPESDHQLLSDTFHVAESQNQTGGKHGDSGSTRGTEPESKERYPVAKSHSNSLSKPNRSDIHCNTHTGIRAFKCGMCGKVFKFKSRLNVHLRTHTGEKPYCCDTCGKRFSQSSSLNTHIRLHTEEKPYSCETCGKSFRRSHGLVVHRRSHTGEKPHSCKICGKDFPFGSNLEIHMRTHTGEKPYLCRICGKRFSQISIMKNHTRTHTGEKPYSCKTCGDEFRRSHALKIHMRMHTGEKPYPCKICGKDFRVRGHLKLHMRRVHTGEKPYLCKTCGKRFSDISALKRHMMFHTGEKPYSCDTCGKRFYQKADLIIHIRSHTGERPYLCKTCGKEFTRSNALTVHTRRAHTGEKQNHSNI